MLPFLLIYFPPIFAQYQDNHVCHARQTMGGHRIPKSADNWQKKVKLKNGQTPYVFQIVSFLNIICLIKDFKFQSTSK